MTFLVQPSAAGPGAVDTRDDQWLRVLNNVADEEEVAAVLEASARELEHLLTADERAGDDLLAVVERRVDGEITEDTWGKVQNALIDYAGVDVTSLVSWLVVDEFPAGRMDLLARHASPGVARLLRRLLGLHGWELERAFSRWREFPDEWRTFTREVLFDPVTNEYRAAVRILKFNDEWITLKCRPDSFLNLTRYFLATARLLPGRGVFHRQTLEPFLEELDEVRTAFAEGLEPPPDSDGG